MSAIRSTLTMKSISRRLLIFAVLLLGLGAFLYRGLAALGQPGDTKSSDHVMNMTHYSKEGRFDKALEEGELALKAAPGNPAILSQVAMVCLLKAKNESSQREPWIQKGSEYAHQALTNSSGHELATLGDAIQAARILD